MSGLKDT